MSGNTPFKLKKSMEPTKYKPNATTPQTTKQTSRLRTLAKGPNTDPNKRHSSETTPDNKIKNVGINQPALRRFSEASPKLKTSNRNTAIKESSSTPECYKPVNIGTPMSFSKKRSNESAFDAKDPLEEEDSSIIVAVRVRPLNQREINDPSVKSVVEVSERTVTVNEADGGSSRHQFAYDHCFWSADKLHLQYADQQKVYETIAQPMLDKAFQGYNTCLFAYGQTGSGKSYSIMGQQDWDAGIVTRFAQELFERIACSNDLAIKICIEISFFEIYNEKIHDLLASDTDQSKKKAAMRVREHPVLGPYIVDLSTFVVTCYDDLTSWLSLGNKQRATASTGMNEKSSRSHSVLTVVITQTELELIDGEPHEHSRKSKVNLVDLAGSERINISKTTGTRTKEGVSINKSLLTLGKVISQLAETSASGPSKKVFVPYRESVLTWLLKESLGGNSKTTMLATISPVDTHIEETLSTLRYAKQARNIVNVARVNEDPKARLIRVLRAEIEKLLGQQNIDAPMMFEAAQGEIQALREQLRDSEQLLQQATKTWKEKLQQATKRKAEEAKNLQKVGIAFQINNQLPNLVNLNEDPQLSETLLYLLNKGDTRVGRMHLNSSQNIQLKGTFILDYHCTISNANDVVTLIPNNEGQTYINGHLINVPTHLVHGDRIILGGEHYFRFNNPLETCGSCRKSSDGGSGSINKDFLFAKSELLSIQEAQMKAALEKERERTRQEMLQEIETIKSEAEIELGMQRNEFENRIKELNAALEVQNLEIENAESMQFELELQNKLLQQNIEIDKQQTTAKEVEKLTNFEPMQTNFLDEIVQYLALGDSSIVNDSDKTTSEIGLYELSIMLKEANQISKELGKKVVFSQWDRLTEKGLEIIVKAQDTAQNLKLEWPVQKFREKLVILRQILEDQDEFDLFDSGDLWTKDEHLSMSYSSKVLDSFRRASPYLNDSVNFNTSFSFSDMNDSIVLPAGRRSILPKRQENAEAKIYQTCREQCTLTLQAFTESNLSKPGAVVARILQNLSHLRDYENDLKETLNNSVVPRANTIVCQQTVKLSNHFGKLMLETAKISTLFSIHIQMVCDLREKLTNSITKLGNAIIFIIQGMETESDSLVEESILKLNDAVLQCSELMGQVTASLGISLQQEENPAQEKVKLELALRFICGLEAIVRKALKSAVESLEDVELRINMLADDSFFGKMKDKHSVVQCSQEAVTTIRRWASKFCEIQIVTSENRSKCSQYMVLISIHSQQVVINFTTLTEAMSNLPNMLENYVKGDFLDSATMLDCLSDVRGSVDTLSSLTYLQLDKSITASNCNFSPRAKVNSEMEKQFKGLQEFVQNITTSMQKLKKAVCAVARSNQCTDNATNIRSTLKASVSVHTCSRNPGTPRSGQLPSCSSRSPKSVSFSRKVYLNDSDAPSIMSKSQLSKSSVWNCSEASMSPSTTYSNGSTSTLSGFSSLQIEENQFDN